MRTRYIEIIAEMGINHNGSMGMALNMIHEAKSCGADVLKTQLYDPKKDFGDPPREPELFSKSDWSVIYASRLTREQVGFLNSECGKMGIEFMSSVTDLERLEWLEEIGVKRHKIASDVAMDAEMCKAIISKGKPTLISDGQIRKVSGWPAGKEVSYHNLFWLYCVSEYPTGLDEIEFVEFEEPVFGTRRRLFEHDGWYDGFSDHTVGISAAVTAMSLGARIIEKHFTLGKNLPGPDHVCSADLGELRQLCKMRDDIEKILYKD